MQVEGKLSLVRKNQLLVWTVGKSVFLGFKRTPYKHCFWLLLFKDNQVIKETRKSPPCVGNCIIYLTIRFPVVWMDNQTIATFLSVIHIKISFAKFCNYFRGHNLVTTSKNWSYSLSSLIQNHIFWIQVFDKCPFWEYELNLCPQ